MEFWEQSTKMKTMTTEKKTLEDFIKETLANYLGVESEDIKIDDELKEDLNMTAIDLSNIVEILEGEEVDTTRLDITNVNTVDDLADAVSSKKYL